MGHLGHEPLRRQTATVRSELPTLLTSGEVADLLRTTRKAVYAMVERRQIPGVIRLGRRVLFQQKALIDWLGQKSSPSER
jgi:excisionase family DNA binding protein